MYSYHCNWWDVKFINLNKLISFSLFFLTEHKVSVSNVSWCILYYKDDFMYCIMRYIWYQWAAQSNSTGNNFFATKSFYWNFSHLIRHGSMFGCTVILRTASVSGGILRSFLCLECLLWHSPWFLPMWQTSRRSMNAAWHTAWCVPLLQIFLLYIQWQW